MNWRTILEQRVAQAEHAAEVARELGIAPSTLSLVLADKYPASTASIERKVLKIYGRDGLVQCPQLGPIEPGRCATNFQRAKTIGTRAGNPRTIRLFKACLRCDLRG